MTIQPARLAIATSALWAVLALPVAQSLPDTYGVANFTFWYVMMLYPVWVVYGWRWISENAKVPFKLWGGLIAVAGVTTLVMSESSKYEDFFWIPLTTTASMVALIIILDGWKTFHKTSRDAVLAAWQKPPVWLVLLAVLLVWLLVQILVGMLTPQANVLLLAACGVAWLVRLVLK